MNKLKVAKLILDYVGMISLSSLMIVTVNLMLVHNGLLQLYFEPNRLTFIFELPFFILGAVVGVKYVLKLTFRIAKEVHSVESV